MGRSPTDALPSPQLAAMASPGFSLVEKNTFLHFDKEEQPRRSRCFSDLTGDHDKVDEYRQRSPSMQPQDLSPVPSESDPDERFERTPCAWMGKGSFVPGQSILQQVAGLHENRFSEPEIEPPLADEPEQSCSEPDAEDRRRAPSPSPSDDVLHLAEQARLDFLHGREAIVLDGFDDDEAPGTPCFLDRDPVGGRFGTTGPNPFQRAVSPLFEPQASPQVARQMSPQMAQQMSPQMAQQMSPQMVQQMSPQMAQQMSPPMAPQMASPQMASQQMASQQSPMAAPLMSPQGAQPMSPQLPVLPALQHLSMVSASQLGFLGPSDQPQQQVQQQVQQQAQQQVQQQAQQQAQILQNFAALQGLQAMSMNGMQVPVLPIMPMLFPMPGAPAPAQPDTRREKKVVAKKEPPKPKEPRGFQPPARDPSVPLTELTLMLKNIPNKYRPDQMLEEFRGWRQCIDFFYMPIDFKNGCNLGYAFVNFHDVAAAEKFRAHFHDTVLPLHQQTGKVLSVSEARVQGLATNVERFRNSSVMAKGVLKDEYKPQLFDKSGKALPFPEPEGELPALGPRFRRQR